MLLVNYLSVVQRTYYILSALSVENILILFIPLDFLLIKEVMCNDKTFYFIYFLIAKLSILDKSLIADAFSSL